MKAEVDAITNVNSKLREKLEYLSKSFSAAQKQQSA